jgi:hypothetical protein
MTPMMPMRSPASIVLVVLAAAACGGSPPPAAQEPAPAAEAPRPSSRSEAHAPKLRTKAELGTVDPAAVQRIFSALGDTFMACEKRALDRVELLSGRVKFFVRIGESGAAKWSYLEESDVGDRETEKCLIEAVMGAHWPKPDGGDAEARYGVELPLQAARPPTDWSSEKVSAPVAKQRGELDRCKEGASATFQATMYVGPGGKVLSAGVSTSGKDGAEKIDCLSDALLKLKGVPSPGSWPAKVTFAL